jgi:hypothetical protein
MSKGDDQKSPSRVSLHNRRLSFPLVPEREQDPAVSLVGRHFTATFTDQRKCPVDLRKFPFPRMGREIVSLLYEETQPTGCYKSPGTVEHTLTAVRRLGQSLLSGSHSNADLSLRDLTPADLETFEADLVQHYGAQSPRPYEHLVSLVVFLRVFASREKVSDELKDRLAFIASTRLSITGPPRDAYSPFVISQLRHGALKDIESTIKRMTVDGPRLISEGVDPEVGGWTTYKNVLWAIANKGFTTPGHLKLPAQREVGQLKSKGERTSFGSFLGSCISPLTMSFR